MNTLEVLQPPQPSLFGCSNDDTTCRQYNIAELKKRLSPWQQDLMQPYGGTCGRAHATHVRDCDQGT